jgi:hypothetical protein
MVRKAMMWFVCAVLVSSASVAFGQQKTQLPRQNPFLTPAPSLTGGAEASVRSNALNNAVGNNAESPTLPVFNYTVTASRDGNVYSGSIVGRSPFTDPFGFTAIPTQIVPVMIVTNSVFAGVDPTTGQVLTAPGVTTFDPTVPDDSCLAPPNDVPVTLLQQSPIFRPADFNYGGTDIGVNQNTDALQRGEFFKLLNFGDAPFDDNFIYHVILSPVKTLAAIVINIPGTNGVAYPSAAFGGCPGGKVAIIDFASYRPAVVNAIAGLASQGVNPGTFPLLTLHNVVECEGNNPGCATLNSGVCCILGFHNAIGGTQTFGSADFDTSEIFASPVPDVSITSHEVAEWANDPFGNNPTPAWGHTGQVTGCQANLEVGDPLSGTLAPPIFNPQNGFTYHMQELAFFSWFYGAPSVGVNGWFSNNGTFLRDAGPVCH